MEARALKPALPWFGLSFASVCTALVFFGFSFTLVSQVLLKIRPVILYVHVATAAAWMILLVTQAALAMRRKMALHRKIGEVGFYLGLVVSLSAFAAALILRHDSVVSHGEGGRIMRIAFLSIPLNGAIAFSALLGCAYAWRHRPAVHRRCMLLAAAVLRA